MMMTMEEVVLNLSLRKKVTNQKKSPRMDPRQEAIIIYICIYIQYVCVLYI